MVKVCLKSYDVDGRLVAFYVDAVPSLREMEVDRVRAVLFHPRAVKVRTVINGQVMGEEK